MPRKPRSQPKPPVPAPDNAAEIIGSILPPPPAWVYDEDAIVEPLRARPAGKSPASSLRETDSDTHDDVIDDSEPGSEDADASGDTPAPLPTSPPRLVHRDDDRGLWLYHGNCLELLDAIAAKYPEGRFDCIFADPPYFLSNGGITCHAGKMVKVDKGAWDKSRGPELNHEFNLEWLRRCQRVLKPNGTLWVSGTHHVIFSIGYAMQQLGMKLLNQVTWEKPNPPPHLACRYFTHSTETVLWAAKDAKSKHRFNYPLMREINGGKQMKDVWRFTAPKDAEKTHGKHPTQKPLALLERILLASTNEGDLVLDPFLGGGTTAVAAARLKRKAVGVELDFVHLSLSSRRLPFIDNLTVYLNIFLCVENDLDLFGKRIDPSAPMAEQPAPSGDRIFHETKFVFLSCAQVSQPSVVHTTMNSSLQQAWATAPDGLRRETTHIVRCETEIIRVKTI